jgi:hypothetical protein
MFRPAGSPGNRDACGQLELQSVACLFPDRSARPQIGILVQAAYVAWYATGGAFGLVSTRSSWEQCSNRRHVGSESASRGRGKPTSAVRDRSLRLTASTNVGVLELAQQPVSLFDPCLPVGAIAAFTAIATMQVQAAVPEFTLSDGRCCRGVDRLGADWPRQDNSGA